MINRHLEGVFRDLSTPLVADACVRIGLALGLALPGLAGIIVWGCHRGTAEVVPIGLPVSGCGRCPAGPTRLDPREEGVFVSARIGACEVGREDRVFADDDGVVFVAAAHLDNVLAMARTIGQTERRQAAAVREGRSLRGQLQFKTFLARRAGDPDYTFRKHLRALGGALEE